MTGQLSRRLLAEHPDLSSGGCVGSGKNDGTAVKTVSGIAVSGQNGVSAVAGSTCKFVCVCMF